MRYDQALVMFDALEVGSVAVHTQKGRKGLREGTKRPGARILKNGVDVSVAVPSDW